MRQVPIIIGPQGCGKSSLLRLLFPTESQDDWHRDVSIHETTQERLENSAGSVLCELGEMRGMSKAEWGAFKQSITAGKHTTRLAYRRNAETYLQRYVMVGTANTLELPDDPSGHTRLVVCRFLRSYFTTYQDLEAHCIRLREPLWCATRDAYNAGARAAAIMADPTIAQLAASTADLHMVLHTHIGQ